MQRSNTHASPIGPVYRQEYHTGVDGLENNSESFK